MFLIKAQHNLIQLEKPTPMEAMSLSFLDPTQMAIMSKPRLCPLQNRYFMGTLCYNFSFWNVNWYISMWDCIINCRLACIIAFLFFLELLDMRNLYTFFRFCRLRIFLWIRTSKYVNLAKAMYELLGKRKKVVFRSSRYELLRLWTFSFQNPQCMLSLSLCSNAICRVTNRSPNPDRIGYGPNKPNTINL